MHFFERAEYHHLMSAMQQFWLALATASFFVFSNSLTGIWAKTHQWWLWIPICLAACVGYFTFGVLMKQANLSVSTGLVDTLILICSIIVGVFLFRDVLTARQIIGLSLACASVIILM